MITIKELTKLTAQLATIDDQQLIQTLHEDALSLRETNLELREENGILKQQLDLRDNMKFEDGFYWKHGEEGERDGPYCPGCLDGKKTAVRLHEQSNGYLICTNCKFRAAGPNWTEL